MNNTCRYMYNNHCNRNDDCYVLVILNNFYYYFILVIGNFERSSDVFINATEGNVATLHVTPLPVSHMQALNLKSIPPSSIETQVDFGNLLQALNSFVFL